MRTKIFLSLQNPFWNALFFVAYTLHILFQLPSKLGPIVPSTSHFLRGAEGASSWTERGFELLRWHWVSPLVPLGDVSRGNINAAREAAVITCPFIHPGCPDHWAIELVSLRLGEYLFMQSSAFSKGLPRQKHPIKYNSVVIKHLPRDSGSLQGNPSFCPDVPWQGTLFLKKGSSSCPSMFCVGLK